MRASAGLFLACLALARADLRKCCPQHQSLFKGDEGFFCQSSSHEWAYGNISHGLPAGCEQTLADRGTLVSCIDNLDGGDRVVALLCPGSTFPVPDVHYLGKCCPPKRAYDSRVQSCYGKQNDSSPTAFLNVLMYGAAGVVDLRYGAPVCRPDEVVVDHLLLADKVHRLSSASISFTEAGVEYIFNPDSVCVDRTERRDIFVVRTCEDQRLACLNHTCIRKCCQEWESFYGGNNCTFSDPENFAPFRTVKLTSQGVEPVVLRTPAYWFGGLDCLKYIEGQTGDYILYPDGSIYDPNTSTYIEMGVFCVEHARGDEAEISHHNEYVFICFSDDDPQPEVHIWGTAGMIISSVFLFFTFVVYAALPSLKNLHGKTLMCHVLSLFVAYVSLSTVHLITDYLLDVLCVLLGYITVFSFLASFFWLNVISFDIWWTFGSMRPVMNRKRRELRRFLLYSAYAWLSPCVITVLVILAQNRVWWLPEVYRPDIGTQSCWFAPGSKGVFLFFIGPSGVLMIENLVFFILTARHCSRVKSDLDRVGHTPVADKKFKSDKTRLVMNIKLFVAMGINWGLEFLSAAALGLTFLPREIWYIFDMINACQGLVIFTIFVLKRRVLTEIQVRLEGLFWRGRPPPRQPSVSTLFSANNVTTSTSGGTDCKTHLMHKSVSETRLSPLPNVRKAHNNLGKHKKSQSSNTLLAVAPY